MCVPCVLQVSRAFTFKQVCQRSDQTLRLYLQDLEKSLTDKQNTENAGDANDAQTTQMDEDRPTFATPESIELMKTGDEATPCVLHDLQQTETFEVQYTQESELDNNNLDKCLMIVSSELVEHVKLDETDDGTDMSFQTANGLLENSIILPVHAVHTMQQNALPLVDELPHELDNLSTTKIERNDDDLTTLPLNSDEIPADLLSETYGKASSAPNTRPPSS